MDGDIPYLYENDSYDVWRNKIEYWMTTTNIEPRRRAFAVRTKLEGDYRKLALALDAADLNNDDGLQHLLDKLDQRFKKEKKNKWDAPPNDDRSKNEHRNKWDAPPEHINKWDAPPNEHRNKWDAPPQGSIPHPSREENISSRPNQHDNNHYNESRSRFSEQSNRHPDQNSHPNHPNNGHFDSNSGRNHEVLTETPVVEEDANLSAADKARLRASKLSAKLAAQGKYQTQPMSLLPNVISNPVDQFKKINSPLDRQSRDNINRGLPMVKLPEVKKHDNGGYFAEYDINDTLARAFLVKQSTQDLISNQSGASVKLSGRYLDNEEKRKAVITGLGDKALTLLIQADISAKVLVAIHKVKDVIRGYEKNGASGSYNNYGLSTNQQHNQHHFVQEKLFLGFEQYHPEFNAVQHLIGADASNFTFIIQQTNAKIFLRGKGSGYMEQNSGRESFEALHIYISHPDQNGLAQARQLCESLIASVRHRYNEFQQTQFLQQSYTPPTHVAGSLHPGFNQMHPPPMNGLPDQHFEQRAFNQQSIRYDMRPPYQQMHPMNQHMIGASFQQPAFNQVAPMHFDNSINDGERRRDDDERRRERRRDQDGFNEMDDRDRNRDRERNRSRSRSRSRSPVRRHRSRERKRSRSKSRERNRRSRSRERKTKEKTKRKFSEEPKKRRKFSEDPKLLEKTKSLKNPLEDVPESERPPPKLQFRSSKKEHKPKVDVFLAPPPLPPSFGGNCEGGGFKVPALPNTSKKSDDIFKAPPPINILKAAPKALKIGALSSLIAYDDDSDED